MSTLCPLLHNFRAVFSRFRRFRFGFIKYV
nr:MAG TPA: hypothetical protein [Caudoviricetes sp.]DAQ57668.1 MAG TPA: hypothetical protein [Caudoviricetes sp.]DAS50293.1 MAG TPA: hypothetical protein [Caudoviricetes sp.]